MEFIEDETPSGAEAEREGGRCTATVSSRLPTKAQVHEKSAFVARLQSFDTWCLYLLMRWILPLTGLAPIVHNVSKLGSRAPRLNEVKVQEEQGTKPLLDRQPKAIMKTAPA